MNSAAVQYDTSDHRPILFHFKMKTQKKNDFITFRKLDNLHNLNSFIGKINSQYLYAPNLNDTNISAEIFSNRMYHEFQRSFPLIKVKIKNVKRPKWMTDDLKLLITKKHKLLKLANRLSLIHI